MTRQNILSFLKKLAKNPAFRILVSICLLTILLVRLENPHDLWKTMRGIPILLWVLVLVAFIAGHIIGVLKWRLFINLGTKKLPVFTAFRCYFAGLFSNFFLPSAVGGDVVRAGLAIHFNGEKEAVIVGSVLDRFLDTSSLGVIILIGALFSRTSLDRVDWSILLFLFISIVIVIIATFVFLVLPIPRVLPKKIIGFIERIKSVIRQLVRNPHRAVLGFLLAVFIQSSFVILSAILGNACNIDLPLYAWFFAWPLAKLAAMIPISLGGLGVREMALAAFLNRFGVPEESSIGLGLLWETIIITGGAMGGVFYFLSKKSASNSNTFFPGTENIKGEVVN
ncbi:MAG: flippase-like domain-containing protein [Planctomycetes bacterium]|nr:flippase-like domain-containing protein [Planctomycetota bacterium]